MKKRLKQATETNRDSRKKSKFEQDGIDLKQVMQVKLAAEKRQTDLYLIRQAKPFKRRFDMLLRHVKLILINYRDTLPQADWQKLITETRTSVLSHPVEYLGRNIPDEKTTTEAIHLVFDGFMQDMHIRKVQSFRSR